MAVNLWSRSDHALDYLERADSIKHCPEGESTLLAVAIDFSPAMLDAARK